MNRMKRLIIVVMLMGLAFITTSLRPANAQWFPRFWTHGDSFESNPGAVWGFSGTAGRGWFSTGAGYAHTGTASVGLESQSSPSTWWSVGKTLNITPKQQGYNPVCNASIYLSGFYFGCTGPCTSVLEGGIGNFEIIDPQTWSYVALTQFNVSKGSGYVKFTTANWSPPRPDVVVRVSLMGNADSAMRNIFVDDLALVCTY